MFPLTLLHHSEDLWLEGHKVTFDGPNKLIIVNAGVTALSVKNDIYSSWKEWNLLPRRDFNKFVPAIRTIGGDPTVPGQFAGDIYFLINGWRLKRKANVALTGALFSDDFDSPSIDFEGNTIGLSVVSSLVTAVAPDLSSAGIPTAAQTAAAVRAELNNELLRVDVAVSTRSQPGDNMSLTSGAESSVVDSVWDEQMSGHLQAGSAGAHLNALTVSNIADAVLTALISDHQGTPGSLAETLMVIKGLVQSNFMLDNTTYSQGVLSSARIRIFSTGAQVSAATDGGSGQGELASFQVTAETEGIGSADTKTYKVRQI